MLDDPIRGERSVTPLPCSTKAAFPVGCHMTPNTRDRRRPRRASLGRRERSPNTTILPSAHRRIDLARELEDFSLNCRKCGLDVYWSAVSESLPGHCTPPLREHTPHPEPAMR
jgi:hypothetical protein